MPHSFSLRRIGLLGLSALVLFLASGCAPEIPEISGTAYFIDCERGSNDNPGDSAWRPWNSVERINQMVFQPGDGIFFKRGTSCQGALTPQGSGAEGRPILVGAYGSGEFPIIDGGKSREALKLSGQEYWEIQDLEITGGMNYGVLVSGAEGVEALRHIRLTNLKVHDVWGGSYNNKNTGLVVVLANGSRFQDVVINGVTAYNTDQWAGIEINGGVDWPIDYDAPALAEDVTIRNSTVSNVYGDGIVLWGVKNGLIEYSVAYDTGQQPAPKTVGTPSSIWTWSCVDCVVQYNESYNADSPEIDGGCYDIDWGTRNNIYQYNYGHDCNGYCLSVFGAEGVTTENAIVRYNVCANNGQRADLASRQGDIFLSTWNYGLLDGVLIYNNTFNWSPAGKYPALVNRAEFTGERPNLFANNIIVSEVPWLVDGGSDLKLDHNLYWLTREGKPFFSFKENFYPGFEDYQQLSGQDAHGIYADPLLRELGYHAVGASKTAYTLQSDSPAIDAGLLLDDMGGTDFFDNSIPYGNAIDIGAHEWSHVEEGANDLSGLIASLARDHVDLIGTGTALISFVDPQDELSRSQSVFLRSMAEQYGDQGLQVLLVDVTNLTEAQRVEVANRWHLGALPFLGTTAALTTPVTLLLDSGSLQAYWHGLALPSDLVQQIQTIIQ